MTKFGKFKIFFLASPLCSSGNLLRRVGKGKRKKKKQKKSKKTKTKKKQQKKNPDKKNLPETEVERCAF